MSNACLFVIYYNTDFSKKNYPRKKDRFRNDTENGHKYYYAFFLLPIKKIPAIMTTAYTTR